jgi:1-acyl-sn-glycerol-3-phosphate acyltransferase
VDVLARGGRVVVFAEDRRSATSAVGELKSGAFWMARLSGRPIVPVAIGGTRHVIPKSSRRIAPGPVGAEFLEPRAVSEGQAGSMRAAGVYCSVSSA